MSLDRPPSPPNTLVTSNHQYASYSDSPSTYRSFNTMPPPTSATDGPLTAWLQIHSLSIPQAWESPISGAGAGFASGIVTCPLDVIKTKLQAQGGLVSRKSGVPKPAQMYNGFIGSMRTIVRDEGIRGLYRGLGPMLLGYLPTWAVYLTIYEKSRQPYYERCENWWLARCYASLTAGLCSTILTNPIWVIKTRLMSQSNRAARGSIRSEYYYNSTWDAARKMFRAEGIRSFYSGLTPAILGLTHVAVQFPLYEFFKMQFTGYGIGEHPEQDTHTTWIGISAATFLSKTCASTATYPHEVLRTRLQTQYRRYAMTSSSDGMQMGGAQRHVALGLWRTCKTMLAEEGWRAFYAGLGTNLIRAIPSAMTTMLTYELLQRTIHDMKAEGTKRLEDRDAYPH